MTENKEIKKKTLGISSGKLGISDSGKLDANFSPKIGFRNMGRSASSVVVVKKGAASGSGRREREKEHFSARKLTQEEMNKRVEVLKTAERERDYRKKDIKPEVSADSRKVEKDTAPLITNTEQYGDNKKGVYSPNVEPIKEPVMEQSEPKSSELSSFKKGEIRNLDKLYSAAPNRRPSGVVSAPVKVEKDIKSITSNNPSSTFGKKKISKDKNEEEFGIDIHSKKSTSELKWGGRNKLSISALESGEEVEYRTRSLSSIRRAQEKRYRKQRSSESFSQQEKITREVEIPDLISVQELSNRMAEKASALIKALMNLGMMVTVNQSIDADTAELLVAEFGHKPKRVTDEEFEKSYIIEEKDDKELLEKRSPVVTIMGHVDHGKTSLLDALRSTDVAAKESGGITQHIGAYMIQVNSQDSITFLDTPGHEAFTAMRMRGAKVTDIVVLVVAADDNIKEQTIEAINHAKAAGVAIIVAINKIDKPDSNPKAVRNSLLVHSLVPEDMGGDVIVVEVSAKEKIGLDKLEAAILLQADLLSLKANYKRSAKGAVIESRVDKGRGIVASLLVQAGTLRVGDIIVAGSCYGKIKSLVDDKKLEVKMAPPSMPVEVLGLNQVPTAGDEFMVVGDERTAKELADFRAHREKEKKMIASRRSSIEQLFLKAKQSGEHKELSIIIKADVHGSVEAITSSLLKLPNDEVSLRILHSGVGGITESDITLAAASEALVLGFNVRANNPAKDLAKNLNVNVKYYSIIYNIVDEIRAVLSGMLPPDIKEKFLGYADVRQVFDLTKFGKVAGCYVTEGMIHKAAHFRLLRDNVVIHEGKLKALKRFKEDIREVKTGFECGISFERYEDIKVGDKIEAFERTEEARVL